MPRLQKFLPIVLIALAAQILAPIAVSWATARAITDPLQTAEICHSSSGAGQSDHSGGQPAHDGLCTICCIAQASASTDTPQQPTLTVPYRAVLRVVWNAAAAERSPFRAGTNAQARAPPLPM